VRRDTEDHVVVVLNFTPVPRDDYRIGAPAAARYVRLLSSDAREYGGSEYDTAGWVAADPVPSHGYPQSLRLKLPPLGALILAPER
jgi:1,4-alpha-glucan branching enzyme